MEGRLLIVGNRAHLAIVLVNGQYFGIQPGSECCVQKEHVVGVGIQLLRHRDESCAIPPVSRPVFNQSQSHYE